ncbi:MAG: hypothetical protein JO080_02300 [Mucilaginibacter sp.]|nr:hypothetical protein [Mucilaginibacter sp.]
MKIKTLLLALLFTLLFNVSSFGQNDSTLLSRARQSLSEHFKEHPVEKVYLHLDKPAYIPGDTIWFKAYTVVGEAHQLSALSGILYCELINAKDSILFRRVLKLTSGISIGEFPLARRFPPGQYHVRAYTNWMRNAGAEYFYNQAISIGGTQPDAAQLSKISGSKPDVQFFPEGGELVNGIRSRVAVKSVGNNGLGEDVKGLVKDNDGNEIAFFETRHLGMGVFAITPQEGKTYKATITCADSSTLTVDLPQAKSEGFTLAVNNSDADSVYIKVAANEQLFRAQQNSSFYLLGQSAGKVYYMATGKLVTPVFTAQVARKRFPSGVVQFTLFSQNGEPLQERIIFVRNDDTLKMEVAPKEQKYSARQKVNLALSTLNPDKQVVQGSFSVSVYNESLLNLNENKESTILNNLLLTSDLKGYIEQPNYYFINTDDKKWMDLDILMLTQGYRRFEWKQVLNNNNNTASKIYSPENSLELSGALKTPSGKTVPNGKIILVAPKQGLLTDTVTDVNGNFKFTNLNIPDTAKIILRARKENNGSNVTIYVKQGDYPPIFKSKQDLADDRIKLTPEMIKNIEDYRHKLKEDSLKNGIPLSGVTIKAKKEHKPDQFNNYGTAFERSLDMNRARDYANIFEAIRYLVPSFRGGKVILNGLDLGSDSYILANYSINVLEEVRLVDPFGYDVEHHMHNTQGSIVITTKEYVGTDTTVLKGVTIKAKKEHKEPDLSSSANLHGGGNADQVIMGDKVSGCVTLSDCLQGKVFGVSFRYDGTPINMRGGGPMSVILNGLVLDGSNLNSLNANDIYSIEVLRSAETRSIYGSSIQKGGALIITTKSAADPNYVTSVTPAGLITYPFQGYYKAKSFYTPKYNHPKTDSEPFDLRTTIYWNPNIITDKEGKASFDYYNGDTKGTYKVVVEGIDDNGALGRAVFRYKVE